MIRALAHNLKLSIEFTKRDLKERYAGTSFGQLWLLISPLISIFIYTIIFSDFMKMKLGIVENKYAYSIYLIPGLLTWNFFSALVLRLSNSIFEKAHIIKKIPIPMYVFYLSITLTEFIIYAISMVLGILFLLLVHQPITWQFFTVLPCMMILASLFGLGLGMIFSLFNPFFKDLKEVIPIILQLWFWMTPIIYVKEMIYSKYPFLVDYNPIYYFIEPMQNIFLYGDLKRSIDVAIALSSVFMTILLAMWLYKKMIKEIKDII
ncbi:ABC transporter permease [Nitratiruptor sp. SB155-2]|uniref:ABC transporter permease n=1 Tax=Nitratiruptor sp. (strain SB155-2) TaxID=387092 RepID=UPI00015873B9|nr:ABC transporter permease [Nitratiruptor sp. SB155-2]BAF70489.1 ABC transporter, permease [Nitratiruptor sp. SB155-2]